MYEHCFQGNLIIGQSSVNAKITNSTFSNSCEYNLIVFTSLRTCELTYIICLCARMLIYFLAFNGFIMLVKYHEFSYVLRRYLFVLFLQMYIMISPPNTDSYFLKLCHSGVIPLFRCDKVENEYPH